MIIKLSLTIDETNKILEALGELPAKRVYKLVKKIHDQVSEQVESNDKPNKKGPKS